MKFLNLVLLALLLGAGIPAPASLAAPPPKLVVVLVIDQFRSDNLARFEKRFKPARGPKGEVGGFQYLMSQGAYYPYAEYELLQCLTAPGHATILTGSYPYRSGIPLNYWYDSGIKDVAYCAEDREIQPVGAPSRGPRSGVSPRNLIGSTLGDELKNSGQPSRVISISLKDRSAILMGGHRADLALWIDKKDYAWISSRFYLPDGKLPAWVAKLNEELAQSKGKTYRWEAPGAGTGLSLADPMIVNDDWNTGLLGKAFPHQVTHGSMGSLASPIAVDFTVRAAERAVSEYKLGQGKGTDLLAVSFSSHDYLAHALSSHSRENEEMVIEEDRAISRFLNYLKKSVPGGLDNVVIAFTGDHGGGANPDWMKTVRFQAGRIPEEKLTKSLQSMLSAKLGKLGSQEWLAYAHDFNYYLSAEAKGQSEEKRERALALIKSELAKLEGVAHVFTSSDYRERKLPPGIFEKQILKTYYPGRSGDVIVIPKPFYVQGGDTATHLTGYSYDRMVPLILVGRDFKPGRYSQPARIVDIAPTLAFITGVTPPALSEGRVLSEAIASGSRR